MFGGGGGNRTRPQVYEKREMARDFRKFPAVNPLPSPDFESPGVPYSPLESPPVVETFWRRDLRLAAKRMNAMTFISDEQLGHARGPASNTFRIKRAHALRRSR